MAPLTQFWEHLRKHDALARNRFRDWLSKHVDTQTVIRYTDFDVYARHNFIVKHMLLNGEKNSLILDVGGRINSLVPFLPNQSSNYTIVVLNLEYKDLLNPQSKHTVAVQGDASQLPFVDNSFDVVTSITTLEHIPRQNRESYLRELYRVARRKVLVYTPFGPAGDWFEVRLFNWSVDSHIRRMTKQHIDNLLPTVAEVKAVFPECVVQPIQNAFVWLACMVIKQLPYIGITLPHVLYTFFLRFLKFPPYYERLITIEKKSDPVIQTQRKKILVISKCLPRHDRGSGHVRFMSILGMLKKHYDVVFVAESFLKNSDIDDSIYQRKLENMNITVLTNIDWEKIGCKYDIVIFEFLETAVRHFNEVKRRLPKSKIIVDSVDVHFAREQQMAEVHNNEEMRRKAEKTMEAELSIYRAADCVWAVSEDDRAIIHKHDQSIRTDLVTNVHTVEDIDRDNVERNTLLFIGNYWHQPNVDAVLYFCREIFPLILARVPDAVFNIVGNAPTPEIRKLESDHIHVIGWVPDTKPYLAKCHISVVPLRYGAGMKGKVGEAMGYGVPVVTTNVGVQGINVIHGEHLLIADGPDEFAQEVIHLLHNDKFASSLSEHARVYIEEHLTPEIVGKCVLQSLETILYLDHTRFVN